MNLTKSQMSGLLLSLLFLSNSTASAEYKPYTNTEQDIKLQSMEKPQNKWKEKAEIWWGLYWQASSNKGLSLFYDKSGIAL